MSLAPHIKAVCFDAFGTVVDITDKRRPYIGLLRAMEISVREGAKPRLMREPLSLEHCIARFTPSLKQDAADRLRSDLNAELASIKLRPRLEPLWHDLRAGGYKIAICSNLAADYGPALIKQLPFAPDELILSYETGYIKPEAEIYRLVCDALNMPPEAILFTGDTQSADVDGPIAFGMDAELIDPFTNRILGSEERI